MSLTLALPIRQALLADRPVLAPRLLQLPR
jgi:hypothetical protein